MDIANGLRLSKAVKDKSAPLMQFLDQRFPNVRPIQKEYNAACQGLRFTVTVEQ